MKNYKIGFIFTIIICTLFVGCSSSEEMQQEEQKPPQPSATEMMQKELNDLRAENGSLKAQIAKLEQDNRASTVRAAELETQLAELKERMIATPTPASRGTGVNVSNTHAAYDRALNLFRSRNYNEAANTFQAILDAGAPPDLEDNCHYWLGESECGAKNYNEAIGHFNQVFSFARSEKKDDAQIMIANCYYAMGNKSKARAEYQKLIDKYPASPYAKRAKARLEKM